MKILLVKREIYSQAGGAERVFIELSNEMRKRGHDVSVMCAQKHIYENEKPFYPLDSSIVIHNVYPLLKSRTSDESDNSAVKINNVVEQSFLNSLIKNLKMQVKILISGNIRILGRDIYYYVTKLTFTDKIIWHLVFNDQVARLKRAILPLKPDVVISFLPNSFVIVSQALKGTDIKLVVANRNDPDDDFRKSKYFPSNYDISLRYRAVETSALNLVQMDAFKEFFPESVKKKTFVIPNAVHTSDNIGIKTAGSAKKGIIISVGRLTEIKNHELLIKAFHLIKNKYPEWEIRIFGSGRLEKYLLRLIKKLGLSGSVHLKGSTKEIIGEYRDADILAFPSTYEGFSNALAEAMASGLPSLVLKDCVSNRELVAGGSAGLIAENDPFDFSEKLEFLIQNPEKRLEYGLNAIDFVKRFNPEKIYDLWEGLLIDAASGNIVKNI